MRGHPVFARFYAWVSPKMDAGGVAERRHELLAGLSGRVIEVGAGNGRNFAHYPPQVTGVVAVEPEPHLRELALQAAERGAGPVEVVNGTAERLPYEAAAFDAAVASLMLCSVADQQAALAEMYRVVRPGGQLRFLEHVRADTPGLARVQHVLEATVWPTLVGGCHPHRDTAAAIAAAGFAIDMMTRFRFPDGSIASPTCPHIIGRAVRPESG